MGHEKSYLQRFHETLVSKQVKEMDTAAAAGEGPPVGLSTLTKSPDMARFL